MTTMQILNLWKFLVVENTLLLNFKTISLSSKITRASLVRWFRSRILCNLSPIRPDLFKLGELCLKSGSSNWDVIYRHRWIESCGIGQRKIYLYLNELMRSTCIKQKLYKIRKLRVSKNAWNKSTSTFYNKSICTSRSIWLTNSTVTRLYPCFSIVNLNLNLRSFTNMRTMCRVHSMKKTYPTFRLLEANLNAFNQMVELVKT